MTLVPVPVHRQFRSRLWCTEHIYSTEQNNFPHFRYDSRFILGAAKWKQLTGVTFPVLADENGEFVRNLHFGVSVWNMSNTKHFNRVGWLMFLLQ
jgi:hypothetical protein